MTMFAFAFNNAHFSDRLLLFQVSHGKGRLYAKMDLQEVASMENENNKDRLQLHINSVILAANSEYFMSLFCNGMSESSSEVVVVQVTEEERLGLVSLIEYMYTGNLKEPSTAESTLMLLCLADRFAIHSCMEPLVDVFKGYPCTVHDCLSVLCLPETLKSNRVVQPIVESCCNYLRDHFQDIETKRSELLSLSMEGMKVILDSELRTVEYEEDVFHLFLDWIENNYHEAETRISAAAELAEVIRFPWLTGDFLEDVVAKCTIMQSPASQTLILEAIKFRSYTHTRQQQMMQETKSHNRFKPRNSSILQNFWGLSRTHVAYRTDTSCVVYFEFPLEMAICMGDEFSSHKASLGPNKYTVHLRAKPTRSNNDWSSGTIRMDILLNVAPDPLWTGPDEENMWLDYTIAMKRRHSDDYEAKTSGHHGLEGLKSVCVQYTNLFSKWFVERGFSFPRWNRELGDPVFLKVELHLRSKPDAEALF